MAWLEPAHVPKQCQCDERPDSLGVAEGSRWQCDNCEQIYIMVVGSQYNEYWKNWRKEAKPYGKRT